MFKKCFIISLAVVSNILCQPVKTYLDTLTKLDEDYIHMVTLSKESKEKLVLPKVSNNETQYSKKYLNLFYSWDTELDQNVSVLLYQLNNEDLLYVDKNNDNDLTDDGNPIVFPLTQDSITFDIIPPNDSKQKLRLSLFRKPDMIDSLKKGFVDSDGNLNSDFIKYAKLYSDDFNFDGKKRSFYFDYTLTLRKGSIKFGESVYSVGLFDYSNNGRFNDAKDLFIIDLNHSGKLNITDNPANVFAIDDVFTIEGKNYQLSEVDKYGKYFVIEETDRKPTNHFLTRRQQESSTQQKHGIINKNFWNKQLVSIGGEKIDLSIFKGKYLFINFWGEWCQPCINEIEELKQGFENNKEKVNFLGVMKVKDIKKANFLIQKNNIKWVNTFITDELIKEFDIKAYPTNVLIDPDGNSYIKEHGINRTFFDANIK